MCTAHVIFCYCLTITTSHQIQNIPNEQYMCIYCLELKPILTLTSKLKLLTCISYSNDMCVHGFFLLLFRCVVELKQKWNQNIHHNEDCVYRIIPTWRAWGTVQTLCYFVVCFQHYCFEDVSVYGFILIYMEKPSLESRLVHVHFVQCAICVKNKASKNENINTRDNLQLSRWHRWDGNRTIFVSWFRN